MGFFKPIPKEYPVTCLYGTPGSKYDWHIDEASGLWLKGRKCCACNSLDPCNCLTPNPVGNHPGTDFDCPESTPVSAACDGMIIRVGWDTPIDQHNVGSIRIVQLISLLGYDNWWITYRHLRVATVNVGEKVQGGQRIAYSGRNGSQHLCIQFCDRNLQFKPFPIPNE